MTNEELQQQIAALTARVDAITAPPTDYYTSRYSGEEADNAVARALPGGEIDSLLHNRNLLDNWDFRRITNVINQKGQSSYTGPGYTIDRYFIQDAYNTLQVTITDDGLLLSNPSDTIADQSWFIQKMESVPSAENVTTSIYVESITGTVLAICGNTNTPLKPGMNVITSAPDVTNHTGLWISVFHNATVKIKAVKLELGSVSTLANDPPADYGTELAKCRRYYQVLEGRAVGHIGFFFVPTPVSMRIAPALTLIQAGTIYAPDGTTRPVTGVSLISAKSNGLDCLIAPDSSFVSGTADWSDFKIAASADL